ncbi:MAG: penicillin-binding transpeptidase domain-containing protein, partial [Pseudomonadota bacterium]
MIRFRKHAKAADGVSIRLLSGAPQTPSPDAPDGESGGAPFAISGQLEGAAKRAAESGRWRIGLTAAVFLCAYLALTLRLMDVSVWRAVQTAAAGPSPMVAEAPPVEAGPRREFFDRNGALLAVNLPVTAVEASGRDVWDAGETAAALAAHLPDVDEAALAAALKAGKHRVVAREVGPAKQAEIFDLGLPGVTFPQRVKRLYPRGKVGAHILGHVDVDGRGVMGMEKWLDSAGAAPSASDGVALAMDLGAQQALEEELAAGLERFSAKAAWGVVLDVDTSEVVALANLPTFDPNRYGAADADHRRNRATLDSFELGSAFKAFTVAMALDSGGVKLTDTYDARKPLRLSGRTIRDFHAEQRVLTVAEIFMQSSNIGSAKMALESGVDAHQAFLGSLGLL